MTKILAVDDQTDNLELICQILEDNHFEVMTALSGKESLEKAEKEIPDVILLDINMPGMDGYEICQRLKKNRKTEAIPIIFVTASSGEENVVKGLDLGAHDYITKPFNERELLSRISVMIRIREAEKKIETLSLTDELTGLYNRRYMYQRFEEEISRAKRNALSLSCLMLDIDFFKKINDTYGHNIGDFVLKELAQILKKNLRGYDAIVRFGGEEFVVILPGTDPEGARAVGHKIREKVEEHTFEKDRKVVDVTVSVGVFGCPGTQLIDDVDRYVKCADEAMYRAKKAGRNRVIAYDVNEAEEIN